MNYKESLEEILSLCADNETSPELVGKIEKLAADATENVKDPGTLEMLMGLVRYGWNSAAEQILNYCMENKVTESFENKIMELLDESTKQKFVYEIFQKHVPAPAPVSDAVEFAEWIGKEDLKLYTEGWCQPGGSNGLHLSTSNLYTIFLTQKQKV